MSGKSVFKRREISLDQIANAQADALASPITADPRNPVASSKGSPHAAGSLAAAYTPGNVYDIPVEIIRSNPMNPRVVYTSQAVDEMALSLTQTGQRVPATAFLEHGHVTLIEGETRLRGARAGGLKTIRVEIQEPPEDRKKLYKFARDANDKRREQTPLDDAIKWKELLESGVFASQAELARELDINTTKVSRILELATLPKRVVTALADHPPLLSFQMLNAIREYFESSDEDKTIEYLQLVVKNGWGYRQVAADATRNSRQPVSRKRSDSESIEYAGGTGAIKVFDGGTRLEIVLKGIAPGKGAELVEKFKQFMAQQSAA